MGNVCRKPKEKKTAQFVILADTPACVNSPCDKADACENLTLDVNDLDMSNTNSEWWLTHLSHAMLCVHSADTPYVRALIDGLDRCAHYEGTPRGSKPCYPF